MASHIVRRWNARLRRPAYSRHHQTKLTRERGGVG
jgi:hypothetical protein